jgi:hypothetical protein
MASSPPLLAGPVLAPHIRGSLRSGIGRVWREVRVQHRQEILSLASFGLKPKAAFGLLPELPLKLAGSELGMVTHGGRAWREKRVTDERNRLREQLVQVRELAERAIDRAEQWQSAVMELENQVRALEDENRALFEQGMRQAEALRAVEEENAALVEGSIRQAERLSQLAATLEMLAESEENSDVRGRRRFGWRP